MNKVHLNQVTRSQQISEKSDSLQYDVFISHSSLDKDAVARPLAHALQKRGLQVWLDEEQLKVGDSIRRGIDDALRGSRFGVVVLSPAYLSSEWGQKELDTFFAKEKYQSKSILPLYHGVSVEDVEMHWPLLADKISLSTSENTDYLADRIQQSIQLTPVTKPAQLARIKNVTWWPHTNWQWLITIMIALAAIIIPLWYSNSGITSTISIQGNMSGGTTIGTQINEVKVDSEAANLIAQSLLQNSKKAAAESIQEKDEEIKRLTETIFHLQQQPGDKFKQDALEKLEEGKPEEAAQLLKQSLAERGEILKAQFKEIAKDWLDVGNIHYLNNNQEALIAFTKATEFDPDNIDAWNTLGLIHTQLENPDDALSAYKNALKLAIDDREWQALIFHNISLTYAIYGDWDNAEASQLESTKIEETIGNQKKTALAYSQLSLIYLSNGKLDKAESFQLKALKIDEALDNQEEMATGYGDLGIIYLNLGELDKAEKFLLKGSTINEALNRQENVGIQYGYLGWLHMERDEMDKACQYWQDGVNIFNELNLSTEQDAQSLVDEHCQF